MLDIPFNPPTKHKTWMLPKKVFFSKVTTGRSKVLIKISLTEAHAATCTVLFYMNGVVCVLPDLFLFSQALI